jgi:cytochrome c-type biogenesis protein CcmH
MRRLVLIAALVLAAVAASPAAASEQHPTLAEMEGLIMCPTCKGQTLEESTAPAADRVRVFIRARIRAGDTRSEIEDKLVAQYGQGILAEPPAHGFGLLAWVLPLAGLALGAVVLGVLAWRWSKGRRLREPESDPAANGRVRLDPELERKLDEELARFD